MFYSVVKLLYLFKIITCASNPNTLQETGVSSYKRLLFKSLSLRDEVFSNLNSFIFMEEEFNAFILLWKEYFKQKRSVNQEVINEHNRNKVNFVAKIKEVLNSVCVLFKLDFFLTFSTQIQKIKESNGLKEEEEKLLKELKTHMINTKQQLENKLEELKELIQENLLANLQYIIDLSFFMQHQISKIIELENSIE
ncbi:hypothetical protein EHP00_2701 [Ecytonucleospora hepatopenaei]|uniref:Uncharacterized protein n=1 Tax=Ecytonucleospora hepatopenaei TaxID=646526 RepID=A0A1W0E7T3_9MICR|nr:hypothetical protein EHP00_771 [Ecytonucleospora hepatopenaei]OQS55310.1 hypothetical protein EHP00_2701 [Ecytonucleospora hepatopenaei]